MRNDSFSLPLSASLALIRLNSGTLFNKRMLTNAEIRHQNLLRLIDLFGGIQPVATALEKSHAQISQLRHRTKYSGTKKERAIGDALAREIETVFHLERGWMDAVDAPFPDEESQTIARDQVVVADLMQRAPKEDRDLWINVTQHTFHRNASLYSEEELARIDAALGALKSGDGQGRAQ